MEKLVGGMFVLGVYSTENMSDSQVLNEFSKISEIYEEKFTKFYIQIHEPNDL
eukprot:gene8596-421_t